MIRGVHKFDDFIIYHDPRTGDMLKLLGRGLVHKVLAPISLR